MKWYILRILIIGFTVCLFLFHILKKLIHSKLLLETFSDRNIILIKDKSTIHGLKISIQWFIFFSKIVILIYLMKQESHLSCLNFQTVILTLILSKYYPLMFYILLPERYQFIFFHSLIQKWRIHNITHSRCQQNTGFAYSKYFLNTIFCYEFSLNFLPFNSRKLIIWLHLHYLLTNKFFFWISFY